MRKPKQNQTELNHMRGIRSGADIRRPRKLVTNDGKIDLEIIYRKERHR